MGRSKPYLIMCKPPGFCYVLLIRLIFPTAPRAPRLNIVNRMLPSSGTVLVDCTAYLASIRDAQAVRKAIIEALGGWWADGDAFSPEIYAKDYFE